MTRAVLVGVAAALVLLMLLSASVYVEMRHTRIGTFVRDSAAEIRNAHVSRVYLERYGNPVDFLGRWVRLNQLLLYPALCGLIGVFVGALTRRIFLATTIGLAPAVVVNSPPDAMAALSIGLCVAACLTTARVTRYALEHWSRPLAGTA